MRYIYEGNTVLDDGTSALHRLEIHVTDLTKVIGGVRTVASWDLDFSAGILNEAELAFYAQDDDDNVWRMGEYPEVYEDGKVVEAPSWIHGLQDARAGIMMKADPQLGTPSYSQGWGPAVNWTDRGQVDKLGEKTCVPAGCYETVLVIAETSQSEPDAQQLKYYASGVGNVRVGWRGGGEKTKETLELVKIEQLNPDALAEVRAKALALEKSAYENSEDVYGKTQPSEYPGSPTTSAATAIPTSVQTTAATTAPATGSATDVVVYVSDLTQGSLNEFEFKDDPASPGGKLVDTPNDGGHLDAPPENDPHVTFKARVQSSVPYRCWVHMKVGKPFGQSQANMLYVQFSGAVDQANQEIYKTGTKSTLIAQGPEQEGWTWVACTDKDAGASKLLINFGSTGEVTVRLQAGMEGVGFDQFLLSPARFVDAPPVEAIVQK